MPPRYNPDSNPRPATPSRSSSQLPGGQGAQPTGNPLSPISPQRNANQSQSAIDLTIETEVKKVKDGYPATGLITALLKHIGATVNLAPRDVYTSGQVYFRSRMVYDGIHDLMKKVDETNVEQLDQNWGLFDKYTTAIPPLERVLLQFYKDFSPDASRAHAPPVDSTHNAVIHIHTWLHEREMLRTALKELTNDAFKILSEDLKGYLVADHLEQRKKDDIATLRVLHELVVQNKLSDKDIAQEDNQQLLNDVKSGVLVLGKEIMQKPFMEARQEWNHDQDVHDCLYPVRHSFCGSNRPTMEELPAKCQDMGCDEKNVRKHIESSSGQPTPTSEELEKQFAELEGLLQNLGVTDIPTAKEMMDLIKLAARIPRPYGGRSVSLIKALYHLDQYSRKPENSGVSGYRYELKQTMKDSIAELNAVKSAAYNLQTFSLESNDYKKWKDSLRQLLDKTKPLFTSFGISGEWSTFESNFESTARVDETHMEEGRKRLGFTSTK
ncbi:hypothetical protein BDZ97DRAFT_1919853 [Flammula alnicola]|nr:hypothetical protein BDZ97DRAFT_1919853 [Flammula alnicola]